MIRVCIQHIFRGFGEDWTASSSGIHPGELALPTPSNSGGSRIVVPSGGGRERGQTFDISGQTKHQPSMNLGAGMFLHLSAENWRQFFFSRLSGRLGVGRTGPLPAALQEILAS